MNGNVFVFAFAGNRYQIVGAKSWKQARSQLAYAISKRTRFTFHEVYDNLYLIGAREIDHEYVSKIFEEIQLQDAEEHQKNMLKGEYHATDICYFE